MRHFQWQGTAGLYVVEVPAEGYPYRGVVWTEWRRGFWCEELILTVQRFSMVISDPFGRDYLPDVEPFPTSDLERLAHGIRAGWKKEPPASFFVARFPTAPAP